MRPFRTALTLASLFVSGCSSEPVAPVNDAGIDAEGDVPVQCGPPLLSGSECEACATESCCAQAKACSRDATCAAHLACVDACDPSDHACLAACESADAGVDDVFGALRTCELVHCQTQCPFASLACGGLSSPVATCDTCLTAQCCAEESAVGTNADAIHYEECIGPCGHDVTCLETCATQHAEGWPPAHALEACTMQRCSGACPNAAVDCIGHVQLPALTKNAIVYGLAIGDYATKAPVVGAAVKLCDRADVACQSPLAEGQTDSNGQIGFYVPVTSPGFTGYADATALGYYPTIILASSPLVDDTFATALIPLLATGQTLAKQAGTTLDTSRASLAMNVLGCNGLGLPYVSLSVDTADGATTMFYVGQNATSTGPQGLAVAFNLPVAPSTVVAKFPLTGQVVSSVSNVPARKGTLTEIRLDPN